MSAHPKAPPLSDGATNQNPTGLSLRHLIAEDYATHGRSLASQGFWALLVHRLGNARMDLPRLLRIPATVLYRIARVWIQMSCGIKLDYTVRVGRRLRIEHFGGIIIGARSIGDDVVIRQNTTLGIRSRADLNAKPIIGSRVDIGAGAVIVGHVTIGDDCVIGANSVVARDVPARSFVRPPRVEIVPLRSGSPDRETGA